MTLKARSWVGGYGPALAEGAARETTPMEPRNAVDSKRSPAAEDLQAFFESLVRDIDDLERPDAADPPPEPSAISGDASQMPVTDEAMDQVAEPSRARVGSPAGRGRGEPRRRSRPCEAARGCGIRGWVGSGGAR